MTFSYPKKRKIKIRLDEFDKSVDKLKDESFIPDRVGDSYNFRIDSGALKDGFGIKEYPVENGSIANIDGEKIENIYYYKRFDDDENSRDDRLIAYCKSGKLYEFSFNGGEAFNMLSKTFTSAPKAVNYKLNGEDVMIFSTDGGLTVYDGENFSDHTAPEITSMCVHAERLFITSGGERTTLWFSENFDPTNWYVSLDEAGFIDFQDGLGRVNKVIEFDGYVYIFRDTGITRLNGYFDQQQFYVDNATVPKDRIFADTVADCGKYVVYLTVNGFYRFGGTYAVPIMRGITELLVGVDNSNAKCVYHNGRYYCALNVKIGENIEKRVVCYDPLTDGYYLTKGFIVKDMVEVDGDVNALFFVVDGYKDLGVIDDKCRLFGHGLEKFWINNEGNFGIEKSKILSYINLVSKGNCTVRIKSDDGERTIFVKAGEIVQRLPVGLHGVNFSIAFESDETGANINSVSLEFSY